MKKFLRKHWTTILLSVILLAGLCLLMYPTFSDWWNSFHQTRAVASYQEAVKDMSGKKKKAMLKKAREYNRRLAQQGVHFLLSDEEMAEYESILDITGTGIMGYIQIPKINVDLPIYHGTDEAILQIAVGHLAGTSFPIGGENTHAVMSGHRGLPSARLFTDLDQMEEGDTFTVTVLDRMVTYQVDQIRIVLPEEVEELNITDGEDYCTLVTCTPYGVNTHRILVRGTRIANTQILSLEAEAKRIPAYLVIPAVGIPLMFLMLLVMLLYYGIKAPRASENEILERLKKDQAGQEQDQPAEGKPRGRRRRKKE